MSKDLKLKSKKLTFKDYTKEQKFKYYNGMLAYSILMGAGFIFTFLATLVTIVGIYYTNKPFIAILGCSYILLMYIVLEYGDWYSKKKFLKED